MKVRLTRKYLLVITPETEVEQIALIAWGEKREGEGILVEALETCSGYHLGPFAINPEGHTVCTACKLDLTLIEQVSGPSKLSDVEN